MTVEDEIDRILGFSTLGLSSLELLLFPAVEISESTETSIGFVGQAADFISGVSLVSLTGSLLLLYHRKVDINPIFKWVLIPILVVGLAFILGVIAFQGIGKANLKKGFEIGKKFVKPVIFTLGGIAIIPMMGIFPQQLVNASWIGKIIQYIPAFFSIPPLNKNQFYAIVILVKAGGMITSIGGQVIELAQPKKLER
ncbi:hypothetical protein [Algoriphagus sp.]|uniref:hypothetical protein n=1 Tax=Algoriphagus sp. TaxID=1872435 RepID=UPI002636E849|nr:hypothetical protein [Algoriphagus sp.]